tara:strand:+ start:6316 stop:6480 length:165 start_codon:yes stop_codon:yes gene_type:complete
MKIYKNNINAWNQNINLEHNNNLNYEVKNIMNKNFKFLDQDIEIQYLDKNYNYN